MRNGRDALRKDWTTYGGESAVKDEKQYAKSKEGGWCDYSPTNLGDQKLRIQEEVVGAINRC